MRRIAQFSSGKILGSVAFVAEMLGWSPDIASRINRWHQYRVWRSEVNRFFAQSTGKGSNGETP